MRLKRPRGCNMIPMQTDSSAAAFSAAGGNPILRIRQTELRRSGAFCFAFGSLSGALVLRLLSNDWLIRMVSAAAVLIQERSLLPFLPVPAAALLLFLSGYSAFGFITNLAVMVAAGSVSGMLLCAVIRTAAAAPMAAAVFCVFQIPGVFCLLRASSAALQLSASLRTSVFSSGSRRPDLTAGRTSLRIWLILYLLFSLLLFLFLQRQA